MNPQANELLLELYSRTLELIGWESFERAWLAVMETSPFRPDISEIRRHAGIGVVYELEAEAATELRKVVEAIRRHGVRLAPLPGKIINDKDPNGRVLMTPEREPETPSPKFTLRTATAIDDMGLGSFAAGLEAVACHPALAGGETQFRGRAQADVERRWLECYRRAGA